MFGNIETHKGLNRFSLRSKKKVQGHLHSGYIELTASDNNTQPNWAPAGGKILYQKLQTVDGNWAIWTMDDVDGVNKTKITGDNESATDASFLTMGNR